MVNFLDLSHIIGTEGGFLSYFLVFILMFIEGPIVAYAAAFAASLGYFNVWTIFFLFILGNQIPDVIIFEISKRLRGKTIEKFISRFGLTKARIKRLEENMKTHFKKTTFLTKTIPPLPLPGIIISGFVKIPFKKFFWTYLVYNVLYAIIFVFLGYSSGIATSTFLHYLKLSQYILFIALVLVLVVYFLIKFYSSRLSKKIED